MSAARALTTIDTIDEAERLLGERHSMAAPERRD